MDGFILGFPCSLQAKMEIRGTNVITGLSFFFFSFSSFCGKREHSGSGFYSDFFLFLFLFFLPRQSTRSVAKLFPSRVPLSLSLSPFSPWAERGCRSFLSR